MEQNNKENILFKGVRVSNIKKCKSNYNDGYFYIFQGTFGHNERQTFVGNFEVREGEKLDIIARLHIDPKYSNQYKVIAIIPNNDMDYNEFKKYLLSFKGIGPAKAKKIIDTFGEEVLDVIKHDYLKLVSLGVKETIAYEMHCRITKNETVNKLMELLTPYGISFTYINKIYDIYGDSAIELLLNNPYKLRENINLSYDLVDSFAIKNGSKTINTPRIIGGIKEAMTNLSTKGNSFSYVSEVIEETTKKLNKRITNEEDFITNSDVMKVLIYMAEEEKELIINKDSSCFLPYYYNAERSISRKILRANQDMYKRTLELSFNDLIKSIEEEVKVSYAPNQKDAIETSLKAPISIITGGPGTGKTTTLNGLIKCFKKVDPNIKILLAAPTGMAAKRMESATGLPSQTIHRLLDYKPYGKDLICGRNEDNPLEANVVIVDESSMLDIDLMFKFILSIPEGTQLVLVGDIDQLPSVGPGNVLRDLIESKVIATTRLQTIFRQQGTSTIVINAKNINEGKPLDLSKDDFKFVEVEDKQYGSLTYDQYVAKLIVDEYVRLINAGNNFNNVQILCPMRKKDNLASSTIINNMVQERVNKRKHGVKDIKLGFKIFREGDKVIQLKNNYEKDCFNGDIGYIIRVFNSQEPKIIVKFDKDKEVEFVGKEEIQEQLDLAYAMSVHKSQGSEYDHVLMPIVPSQKILHFRNLLYTGVTRGKKTVTLFGHKPSLDYCISNTNVDKRNSKLELYLRKTVIKFAA